MYSTIQRANQGEGVNFFELVINPDDFGQTVENVFYASFLIKDDRAGMSVDDNGLVRIRECHTLLDYRRKRQRG